MPGDTLVVHLTKVRTNQPLAGMVCGGINSNALPSGAGAPWDGECDWLWTLDTVNNIATPRTPSSKLKNFRVPLEPMVGSIGVAPGFDEAFTTVDLRMHGGNLDYNRITEGVALYFPVLRAGALFSLGDGHAAQGDGEVTGQGLETSLSVEFKVDLIKGKTTRFPWAENDKYVMFSGIGNSSNEALQAATAGLIEWLKERYQLGNADIAMILGTSSVWQITRALSYAHRSLQLASYQMAGVRARCLGPAGLRNGHSTARSLCCAYTAPVAPGPKLPRAPSHRVLAS